MAGSEVMADAVRPLLSLKAALLPRVAAGSAIRERLFRRRAIRVTAIDV